MGTGFVVHSIVILPPFRSNFPFLFAFLSQMRFPLVFATLLLTVAMVACSQPYRRPSDFGRKYIVFGDTKRILCAPGSSCTTEWYQTQYFQNLDNDGVILHIDTNKYKVQEKNYYIQGNNGYNLVSVIRTYSWEWKYLHFQ